jgi:hypothetical protein
VAFGVLAFFVRKGGIGSLVTSLVLTGILLMLFLAAGLGGLLLAGQPVAICVYGPLAVAMGALLVLLIQAMMRSGQVRRWKDYLSAGGQMYPGPAWAGYGQPMPGGYGTPSPPPPPPPPPPTASGSVSDRDSQRY